MTTITEPIIEYRVWSPDRWGQMLAISPTDSHADEMGAVFGSSAVPVGHAFKIDNPAWSMYGRVPNERLAFRTRVAEELVAAAMIIGAVEVAVPPLGGGWEFMPPGRYFAVTDSIAVTKEKLIAALNSGAAAAKRQGWFAIQHAGTNMPTRG